MFQAIRCSDKLKIAYVIEPRFSGGTSAAVAAELRITAEFGEVIVYAIASRMFGDKRHLAPVLRQVIDELNIPVVWDAPRISADFAILHNPSFLKFQKSLSTKIYAQELIVVTHENFLRPGGEEGFDVSCCLDQIDQSTLALKKTLAPISSYNRETVTNWLSKFREGRHWNVLDVDWFNIFSTDLSEPCEKPEDRRGRHSRPGFEKFPPVADLDLCFPKHAKSNVILGANALLDDELHRPHWTLLPFDAVSVESFFEMIDFFVYFTAPTWRESFGRVIAEALAAGKVVLTDPNTGKTFGDAVIACQPAEVDGIISGFISAPDRYREQVAASQAALKRYSAETFRAQFAGILGAENGVQT
ncbi:glycosyltransferase [Ruegeria sp.]|uniref:glycosyltransferase n=1 Tax=Ruegeria sp. TaxID=1879320 RepID=UPI003B5C9DD8